MAEVDEEVGELFLMEEPVDASTLQAAIRRATVALKFVPIFMGRSGLLSSSPALQLKKTILDAHASCVSLSA